MPKKYRGLGAVYYLWIGLFIIAPIILLLYQSFMDINGGFTLDNYKTYFSSINYMKMTLNSFLYAFIITGITILIAYPFAYFLTKRKYKDLWLLLVILPTWVNMLLKAYAFIGIFNKNGGLAQAAAFIGLAPEGILFTDAAFVLVAAYIELPFMVLPIFRALDSIPREYLIASQDLGASPLQTFRKVVFPLSLDGVQAGVQAVFIPSLSLFLITRLIGGNRVITLGTAVEQHYLVTQNWGMGSTIGLVLIVLMFIIMALTGRRTRRSASGK